LALGLDVETRYVFGAYIWKWILSGTVGEVGVMHPLCLLIDINVKADHVGSPSTPYLAVSLLPFLHLTSLLFSIKSPSVAY
jgi:hypothetical protein